MDSKNKVEFSRVTEGHTNQLNGKVKARRKIVLEKFIHEETAENIYTLEVYKLHSGKLFENVKITLNQSEINHLFKDVYDEG